MAEVIYPPESPYRQPEKAGPSRIEVLAAQLADAHVLIAELLAALREDPPTGRREQTVRTALVERAEDAILPPGL